MVSKAYELKQAYIWDCSGWKPWTSTLLYAPFSDDLVDHSWKSTTMTKSWTVTNTTLNWIKCAYFNWWYIDTNISTLNNLTHTISFWLYTNTNNDAWWIVCSNPCWITQWETIWTSSTTIKHSTWTNWWATPVNPTLTWSFLWKWIHVINTWWRLYVDWNLVWTETATPAGTYKYSICAHAVWSSCTRRIWYWYLSELIIEDKEWTAQEVQDYYNSTNDNYQPSGEVTEEFNLNSTTEVWIWKSWYKIKQIMYEENYNYSQSAWYIAWLRTYVKWDNTQPSIYCDNYTWWTYWYDYWYWLGKYWWVVVRAQNSTESSQVSIVKINAWVTTSWKWAFKIIFTRDSVEYHYWQTAWSWTQEWTATLNSTVSWYVNTLFNNWNIYVNEWTWWWPTFTAKVTVTYEPV